MSKATGSGFGFKDRVFEYPMRVGALQAQPSTNEVMLTSLVEQ